MTEITHQTKTRRFSMTCVSHQYGAYTLDNRFDAWLSTNAQAKIRMHHEVQCPFSYLSVSAGFEDAFLLLHNVF